jgi:hypothetical protein
MATPTPFDRIKNALARLTLTDRLVILICIAVFFGTLSISYKVFDQMPHLEDEYAYVWQAEVAARGEIFRPVPECPRCFLVPFVIDHNGHRFGKYPLPWPVLLSFGINLGARELVNPLLAGACIWLLYTLIRKLRGRRTGLISAVLMASSPFFLILSSTLLSHVFSLFLALVFFNSWFDALSEDRKVPLWLQTCVGGLSMGLLTLSRPLTALGVIIPFAFHGLYLLIKGSTSQKKTILRIAGIVCLFLPLYFLWQFLLTGDPLRNPYTLVWPYDTIGFGPGIGRQTGGYLPRMAINNAKGSLYVGMFDLFGWLKYSWIFLPIGLITILRDRRSLLVSLTSLTIIAAYALYWIGSDLFGPRYYFEALPACVLLTAAGINWLLGKLPMVSGKPFWQNFSTWRFVVASLFTTLLVVCTLQFYLPQRLPRFDNLYGASRERIVPFLENDKPGITPALVIVHITKAWTDYSSLTELSNPYFDTPFVFSLSKGEKQDAVAAGMLPGRYVWHYYPDEPFILRSKIR